MVYADLSSERELKITVDTREVLADLDLTAAKIRELGVALEVLNRSLRGLRDNIRIESGA